MLRRIKELLKLNEKQQTLDGFWENIDWYKFAEWTKSNIPDYMYENENPLDSFAEAYVEDHDIDLNDLDDNEDYQSWLTGELAYALEETYRLVDHAVGSSNPISIYRALRISGDYLEHLKNQGKHLGIYWTWEESLATDYEGSESSRNSSGDFYLIETEVPQTNINWRNTLLQNFVSQGESEIQLYKGVPIKIKRMWKAPNNLTAVPNRKELEVPEEIKNKVFFA